MSYHCSLLLPLGEFQEQLGKLTTIISKISGKISLSFHFSFFYSYLIANLRTNTSPDANNTTENNKIGALSPVGGFSSGDFSPTSDVVFSSCCSSSFSSPAPPPDDCVGISAVLHSY